MLRAAEEVDNSLASYVNERERMLHLTRAATAYNEALRLAEERYQSGRDSLQPVLDSQREKLVSETQLAISQANKMKSLIQLYRALGGAWTPTSLQDIQPQEFQPQNFRSRDIQPQNMIPAPNLSDSLIAPAPQPAPRAGSVFARTVTL